MTIHKCTKTIESYEENNNIVNNSYFLFKLHLNYFVRLLIKDHR